jgi:hypothetical protein
VLSGSGLLCPDAAAPIHTDRRRVLIGGAAALAAGLTAMALPSAVSAQSAAPEVVEQSTTTTESTTTTTAETTTTTTSPPAIAPGDTISGTGTFTDATTKIEFIRATEQTTFNIAANWEWLSISWEAGTAGGRS